MARITTEPANALAFLDAIAFSELGAALLALSDDGYNVEEGSTPAAPLLFDSYADHPSITLGGAHGSTAAGRYQLLARFWPPYRDLLKLPDFGPVSQDAVAIQQIKECRAYNLAVAGQFNVAVGLVAHIWASLPGSPYGQHTNTLDSVRQAYLNAGGQLSGGTA